MTYYKAIEHVYKTELVLCIKREMDLGYINCYEISRLVMPHLEENKELDFIFGERSTIVKGNQSAYI